MTLDPVHFDGIARLARQISHDVSEADHRELAETVWQEFLDPLYAPDGDHAVLEPLAAVRRRAVDVQAVALGDPEFPTAHGLDSGTINPTTFKNGLVLDVAQAAMSGCPSDLDLHRGRTIVMTAHTNDATRTVTTDWQMQDAGYCRQRIVQAPRVNRFEEGVVHALSLYLAESTHALDNADVVEDLLYLDGPVYPKGLLNWLDRDQALRALLVEAEHPRDAVQNYVDLVETFVERGVPICGFVKNPGSKSVTRALRKRTQAPWTDDAALFRQVLERRDDDGRRHTDELTVTNWFHSRGGADAVMSTAGDGLDLDRDLDPEAYEVTFCVVYDPRDDVLYKLEAPYAVTRDEETREALTRQVLSAVAAARGPPLPIRKADELARIGRDEKESLRSQLEEEFRSERDRTYDDVRWPLADR
jgi:hypothetical protein